MSHPYKRYAKPAKKSPKAPATAATAESSQTNSMCDTSSSSPSSSQPTTLLAHYATQAVHELRQNGYETSEISNILQPTFPATTAVAIALGADITKNIGPAEIHETSTTTTHDILTTNTECIPKPTLKERPPKPSANQTRRKTDVDEEDEDEFMSHEYNNSYQYHKQTPTLYPSALMIPYYSKKFQTRKYENRTKQPSVEHQLCASPEEFSHWSSILTSGFTNHTLSRVLATNPKLWNDMYDMMHHASLLKLTCDGRNIEMLPRDAMGNVESELQELSQTFTVTHYNHTPDEHNERNCSFVLGLLSERVRFDAEAHPHDMTEWFIFHEPTQLRISCDGYDRSIDTLFPALGLKTTSHQHLRMYLSRIGTLLFLGGGPFD